MSKIYFNDKGVVTEDGTVPDEANFGLLVTISQQLRVIKSGVLDGPSGVTSANPIFLHTPIIAGTDISSLTYHAGRAPTAAGEPSYPKAIFGFGIHTGSAASNTAGSAIQGFSLVSPAASSSAGIFGMYAVSVVSGSGPGITGRAGGIKAEVIQDSTRPIASIRGGQFNAKIAGLSCTADTSVTTMYGVTSQNLTSATGSVTNNVCIAAIGATNTGNATISKVIGILTEEPADGIGNNCTNILIGKSATSNFSYPGNWSIYNYSTRPNFQESKTCFGTSDASATPGSVTINKPSGIVAIAAGNAGVTVTNSYVTASSIVIPTLRTNDNTLVAIRSVLVGSGSFTISGSANATATTVVSFVVYN